MVKKQQTFLYKKKKLQKYYEIITEKSTNTDCLIDIIVRETNMYARQHLSLESKSGGDLRIQIKIYNY
jgi:hypothetical protein